MAELSSFKTIEPLLVIFVAGTNHPDGVDQPACKKQEVTSCSEQNGRFLIRISQQEGILRNLMWILQNPPFLVSF